MSDETVEAVPPGPIGEEADRVDTSVGHHPDSSPQPSPATDGHESKLGSRARGVETIFRTAYRVHMDLTAIADNKASIMITVNGLIVSILLASAAARSTDDRSVLLPVSVALLGSLAAIVFAVLAAKPRLIREPIGTPGAIAPDSDVLFFGNFTGLGEEGYVDVMSDLVTDTNRMYRTMMRDIYAMGAVLEQKFAHLQRAYTAFLAGIVLSVGIFIGLHAVGI